LGRLANVRREEERSGFVILGSGFGAPMLQILDAAQLNALLSAAASPSGTRAINACELGLS
jgi:hypothetical protein